MKRYAAGIGAALGMLVLILDGQTALAGAAEGVALCIRTLIPGLFPFFLLSGLLTGAMPGGLLPAGILGGYPVGAANAARAYRRGQIGKAEAERLIVLCNCAGPSFLFGVLGPVLGGPGKAAGVWAAYLCSVAALWAVLPKSQPFAQEPRPLSAQGLLQGALGAMAGVCGWVICFRTLLAVLDRWVLWLLPDWGQAVVCGILELTNGCLALEKVAPGPRFILAAGMVGFGGLCVILQTAGVSEGLSVRLYFPGKLFQAAVSMLAASLLAPGVLTPTAQTGLALTALALAPILRKTEKRCGNCCPAGV